MNVLFISLIDFSSLDEKGIYTDLLRSIRDNGNRICAISPVEQRAGGHSTLIFDKGAVISKPLVGNIQKTGIIEKGISTVKLGSDLRRAIKRDFSDIRFDLVLYPTPPITFLDAVRYVKRRDGAAAYLMLKDIFPQNAVDIGLMSKKGPKGCLYRHFRKQEKRLYRLSDFIGCMSPANVGYLLSHNSDLDSTRVGLCPNSLDPVDKSCNEAERKEIRHKYGIPTDKTVFVYGGNLGKPQDLPFIIECLRYQSKNTQVYFIIVGDGTEYCRLEEYFNKESPTNARLFRWLPQDDYGKLVASCDVGLVFLDHRFTIPNFPSRILSYMEAKVPVLCATDDATDVGAIAEESGFGVSCSSASVEEFDHAVSRMLSMDLRSMGRKGFEYLSVHYDARDTAQSIIEVCDSIRSGGFMKNQSKT